MKDIYKEQVKRVKASVSKWKLAMEFDRLGLSDIRLRFDEHYAESSHLTVADTEFDWEYRSGAITWYLPAVSRLEDDELEEVTVHELVHVMVASMESLIPDKHTKMCEFAVETVSRAIMSVSQAG